MSIVVTGSIAYDYLMSFPGKFTDQIVPDKLARLSVSFLVDDMARHRGGVAPNIAYSMRLLGGDPIILGTVGQDFGDYRNWLEENGIRTDQIVVIPEKFTASFFVNTDIEQNQIASFYTGAMADSKNVSLASRGLTDAELVIISPSDPAAMLNYAQECRTLGIPFAYDPSQQTARLSGEELRASIPGAAYLMVNDYELAVIQEKTGWDLARIRAEVDTLIVTEGEKGSVIYRGASETRIPIAPPSHVAEPTGAGDAYRGGFFAALSAGLPVEVCGRVGALCSTYVLEQVGTSNHRFTLGEFAERYEAAFGPEPMLKKMTG
ncbi:MAG: carbohydrate kinase family protein [Caldilineaceae bacterium]|nr:carbohydrate kinase family protein [Caldilineaceae bacterium]